MTTFIPDIWDLMCDFMFRSITYGYIPTRKIKVEIEYAQDGSRRAWLRLTYKPKCAISSVCDLTNTSVNFLGYSISRDFAENISRTHLPDDYYSPESRQSREPIICSNTNYSCKLICYNDENVDGFFHCRGCEKFRPDQTNWRIKFSHFKHTCTCHRGLKCWCKNLMNFGGDVHNVRFETVFPIPDLKNLFWGGDCEVRLRFKIIRRKPRWDYELEKYY